MSRSKALSMKTSPSKNIAQQSAMVGDDLDLKKITPELAAKIVKHFVLPMFDNSASSRVNKRLG